MLKTTIFFVKFTPGDNNLPSLDNSFTGILKELIFKEIEIIKGYPTE